MKILNNQYFLLLSRIVIALVFIFAGIEKIADPAAFSIAVSNYKLFPEFTINFIALFIPWLEVIAGILLLFSSYVKENSAIIGVLLVMFIIMIIVALLRGLDIDCGCFGTIDGQKVGLQKIIENILLLLLTINIFGKANSENNTNIWQT